MKTILSWLVVCCLLAVGTRAETTTSSPVFNGGTITNPLTGPSFNASGSGYEIGGTVVLSGGTGANASIATGVGAGASLTPTTTFATLNGYYAGNLLSATGPQELTAYGTLACSNMPAGNGNTCVGVSSMWHELTGAGNTSVGNDNMRDTTGVNFSTSTGNYASGNFWGQQNTSDGYEAMLGNAASVALGGTTAGGGTVTLTFTSSLIPGGASTAAYTYTGSDTLSTIVTGLATAIGANSNLGAVRTFDGSIISVGVLGIGFPGTSTLGTALTVTDAVTGSVTVAITGGVSAAADYNLAIGAGSELGLRWTTAYANIGMGRYTLANVVSGSNNIGIGDETLMMCQLCFQVTAVGGSSMLNVTGLSGQGYNIAAFGYQTGMNCTLCRSVLLLGPGAGSTLLTNAVSEILLSDGSVACDSNASNIFKLCMSTGIPFQITSAYPASSSQAAFAGNLSVAASFTVGSPTGGNEGTGTVNAASGYYANGTAGVSVASCIASAATLTFVNGLLTAHSGTGC